MARTLTEIYTVAKECRNQYLELTEFQNSSKMSILDAFTWVTSSCIWAFENILDVFKVDLAKDLQNRINGSPAYYANALLKYQSGDELEMNDEGTAFSYPTITGAPGAYERVSEEELLAVRAYFHQISFAGTHATIVSRKGDILVPRVTVYYDGAVSEEEVYSNIENALNDFIANISFDGVIYTKKIIDAIQKADHVVDVYVDTTNSDLQGIFIAQYDDDNLLIPVDTDDNGEVISYEQRVDRCFVPNSGFIKQSSRSGEEEGIMTWKEAITLKIEQ